MSGQADAPHEHVLLNITRRCNQRCVFCFEGDRSGWREFSADEVARVLDEARQVTPAAVLMGGCGDSGCSTVLTDTWSFAGASWSRCPDGARAQGVSTVSVPASPAAKGGDSDVSQ